MKVVFRGYDEIHEKLNAKLPAKALANNLEPFAIKLESMAKRAMVVDTGALRSSITHEVTESEAWVGTNMEYAPFVELDTKPHWPPWGPGSALEGWARRHKVPAFIVARAIAKRGTKAKHLEGGIQMKKPGGAFAYVVDKVNMDDLEQGMANDIEKGWSR